MTNITYKGQDWTLREFRVQELDYTIVVAPYELYELLDMDDEYDNVIDQQITYYASEDEFSLPAQELLNQLTFHMTLIEEV